MSSSASPALRRVPLPEGTLPVGLSLLVAGIATYAFFIVGEQALGSEEAFAPIVSLWFATFSLAPGFFLPLEQEMGRALSHRKARAEGGLPVVKRLVTLGAIIVGLVLVAILFASPIITSEYFDGDWWMFAALATAFVAYAPAHLARGICAGTGRFTSYAIVISSDGIVRIVACVALAAIGITAAGPYGFAVALAPLVPVTYVGLRGQLRTKPGPPAEWQEVSQNLGWLLVGTVCAAALLNAGPVTATLLAGPNEQGLVARFGYGVLLARIPLFLFQAVQAALLPRLSRLAAKGEFAEFRDGLRKLMYLVAAVGVVGTAGAFIIGPFVIETVYDTELSGRTLAMLALSSAIYMAGLATAQAVIALQGHKWVALGWSVGVVMFVLGTWLSSDLLFRRIEIGLVISSASALAIFAFALRQKLSSGATPTSDSVMDAITDMPVEG
ncbi:O-antigen/teichoic acid export membrane protein [Ilumatobacter fluminis]|uniref:O-antigen/teichoic acid export membrane protein n=1 Tax=Ilumatobacter fluminis TaxID=467091 RepID=A0A4R7I1I7_9ACTN|nr:lipid II flippase MurJ [Ilumatobacter fluminis]TDT17427.1 O-antigen/teichoic acid export membrane protein [Ilumatobacter fluminis]